MRLARAAFAILLVSGSLSAAVRPEEWKAINYAPRGHPYFRMLYDWFTRDAATGLEVRAMADADLAMLRQSGFNAVHLYLWDQPTFQSFRRKGISKLREPAGFAYPDPTLSARRQWDALDEFVTLVEKHGIWIIPHFVHTPFNDNLDSLSRVQVEQRAETIARWAGAFIEPLTLRHQNILAWGTLYALEPAPADRPEEPNNYSLLWRKVYAALKRKIEAVTAGGDPAPLFTFLYLPSKGRDISKRNQDVPPGKLEGYSLDAVTAKRRFASMNRHLSYELGRASEPDLVYTYLFGPDTAALEASLRELTTGADAVPPNRLFLAEYGISSPFGSYAGARLAFGENGSPTTDLEGQAQWLRQCLCSIRAAGVNKAAYWSLYDAAALWSSSIWALGSQEVSLNGHWGLAFEQADRGFKPAWEVLRDFHISGRLECGEHMAAVVDAANGPVRWSARRPVVTPLRARAADQGLQILSVVSAADGRVSEWNLGSLITLHVSGVRDIPAVWRAFDYPLPRSVFGIQVEFFSDSSQPVMLGAFLGLSDSDGQQRIDIQIPWELAGLPKSLRVSQGKRQAVQVNPFSGYWGNFFRDANENALAFHEDTGAPVTQDNPARSGEAVLLYLTNLRLLPRDSPATGQAFAQPGINYANVLNGFDSQYWFIVDGEGARANSAITHIRLAPGFVGLYQMRLVVPAVKSAQDMPIYYYECHSAHSFFGCFGGAARESETTLPVAPR